MDTTRLSKRGQIVIPKRVRTAHGWEAGLEFIVEDAGDSIKLKPIKLFKKTTIEEVRGCLQYKGPRKSLKDMEDAIEKGAKESKRLPLTQMYWSDCSRRTTPTTNPCCVKPGRFLP